MRDRDGGALVVAGAACRDCPGEGGTARIERGDEHVVEASGGHGDGVVRRGPAGREVRGPSKRSGHDGCVVTGDRNR